MNIPGAPLVGISNSTAGIVDVLGRLTGGSFWDQLQPAKYREIPFGVFGGDAHFGRRNAVHEYPFRDAVWPEDLGRSARKFNLTGFLIGDDCIAQRDKLIKACESPGDGELVHPTFGRLKVSLLGPVAISERWDHGRVFELSFSFIEAGQRIFPTTKISTASKTGAMADASDLAAAIDFAKRAGTALQAGAAVVNQAAQTAASWYNKATQLARDATSIVNLAKSVQGDFGRFAGDNHAQPSSVAASNTSLSGAVAATAVSLQNLGTASANLNTSASNLSASTAGTYGAVAQSVTAALLSTSASPADSLRLLSNLAGFAPAALTDTSQIGTAMNTMQSASADLFRRAAVVALARASASYQPTSQDDAVAVRTQVCSLLDNEITIAADEGDEGTYAALRDVRVAVANDLTQRSAGLSALMTFKTGSPLPALVIARRLYRDVTRADELIVRAAPIHPAFMPICFKALSI
jgi:prophage DNA circulation protein